MWKLASFKDLRFETKDWISEYNCSLEFGIPNQATSHAVG